MSSGGDGEAGCGAVRCSPGGGGDVLESLRVGSWDDTGGARGCVQEGERRKEGTARLERKSGATCSAPRVVGCMPDRVYAATWYSAVRATLSGGRERRKRRSRAPSPRVGPPLPRPPHGARTFGSCRRCIVLQICVNGRALSQLGKREGMRSTRVERARDALVQRTQVRVELHRVPHGA